MSRPETAGEGIALIDRFSELIGRAVSWLTFAMIFATFFVVIARYVFGAGWIWIQESITWMHATVFMLGAAYTLRAGDHVRVDVFYKKLSARGQALVDIGGTVLFLLPLCGYLLYESWFYVAQSWQIGESSRDAGGMRGVFLLKTLIPVAAGLLALQGVSEILRAARRLRAAPDRA